MSETLSHTNYQDNSFNLDQAGNYILLIRVNDGSFDYAIAHDNRLLVYVQDTPLDELANPKHLRGLLSAPYKNITIGLPAMALTLAPDSLYNEEHVGGYAKFLDVHENEKVLAQPFDDQNKIIYKTGADIISALDRFGLQNTVYAAQGWTKAIANSSPPNSNLYLDIQTNAVQFLYFSFGKLRFCNTFEFRSPDELVYFTTLVAEDLSLNAGEINLIISGNAFEWDANLTRLKEFYPKAELNSLQVLELPSQIAVHKILSLAALSLCGSSAER
jgi:hypothetical protein